MNLILLSEDDFIEPPHRVRLRGRRFTHIAEVHRAAAGDELAVGLLNGPAGTGRIVSVARDSIDMELHLDRTPPPPLPVTLVLALPRPKVLKRALVAAATLGIKRIFLINAYRVEKSFWKSPVMSRENVREYLMLGLEQARDTVMPDVSLRPRFKPFVEDELPEIARGSIALVAHPAASDPCPRSVQRPVVAAIGPEGGFIPYEIDLLRACGFTSVSLGARILRVETALPFFIAKLF
ncbi:MAG: 16S rRNA (uracil(1498)-N(3))-methyltransferase [Nitrospirota bacterium]